MQLDASQVHHPRQTRRAIDDDLLRGAAGGKRERHRLQPRRPAFRRALLVEWLALGAVYEAFEHEGSIPDAGDRARRDGEVILNQLELRELHLSREVRLVRIGDPDLVTLD